MNAEALNAQLTAVYAPALAQLRAALPADSLLSEPHLISVPDGYAAAPTRLMVVGQQTCGWGFKPPKASATATDLMKLYAEFALGSRYRATPFWQAARQLYAELNPDGPPQAFLWSNLVKMDRARRRPPSAIENLVAAADILPHELRVTAPNVVVFFTGPSYDDRLRATFPGAVTQHISATLGGAIVRVVHPSLPTRTFRTYHPAYLRRSHNWAVLHTVASLAREA